MKLINGRIDAAAWVESPNCGRRFSAPPTLLVIHYTAGRSYKGAIGWLCNKASKASAHFVVGRFGEIAQLVNTNRSSWHAGVSSWGGRKRTNDFSVAIELDNFGLLKAHNGKHYPGFCFNRRTGQFQSGTPVPDSETYVDRNGRRWHRYSESQMKTLVELVKALRDGIPTLKETVGHEHVAPKRKLDPGPAFDWKAIGGHSA